MIHRPDRVNSDLDDRLIKPNEARSATNLRMGASLNDTNLGITLVNGLKQLPYAIPAGNNVVIGTREDFETGWGYFALWNSNGDHGIWRTDGQSVEKVIAVVGFTQNMDVSIAVVDGKIYWTDNVNQPRMCNIAKGVANLYPTPYQEWFFTQIKRQPGVPLELSPTSFTLWNASSDYANLFTNQTPIQLSYYYVYDNNEESRLAPWSPCSWFLTNLTVTIPSSELNTYLLNINLIKEVVFVYRNGNNGVVYEAARDVNDGFFTGTFIIPFVRLLPRKTVSSQITNADFDSVPLAAITNEIAQNRMNHGNYLIDYPNWTQLTLTLTVTKNSLTGSAANTQALLPSGRAWFKGGGEAGIELRDEWGRKIGVVAVQSFNIPEFIYQRVKIGDAPNSTPNTSYVFKDDLDNIYKVDFLVSGIFPSWCKYWNVVYRKQFNYINILKTTVRFWVWYSSSGVDYFSSGRKVNATIPNGDGSKIFNFRGVMFQLTSGEPFLFDPNEEQYIYFADEYYIKTNRPQPTTAFAKEYRIVKAQGNQYFIEGNVPGGWFYTSGNGNNKNNYWQPIYQAYIYTKRKVPDDNFYQSTASKTIGDSLSGTIYGDCYFNAFKKTNSGSTLPTVFATEVPTTPVSFIMGDSGNVSTIDFIDIEGFGIAMNPTNTFSQIWDSDIGQANVVNLNQRQTRLQNQFIFSDPLVQGTQINGLSKFNSVDNRQTPLENGPITALFTANARQGSPGVLLAIGRLGISSFYVGATQLTNVDGSSNVASTTDYAVSQNPLLGQYGASKIRNICKTPLGTLYWWSEIVNDWIRYSQAGLDRLGATNSFMNDLRKNLAGNPSVFTTYDQVTNEAILIGQGEQAFVFSEQFNTLQPKRDYYDQNAITPERGMSLAQKNIFFLNGILYVMGPNEAVADNSFFGSLKDPSLTIVSNVEPTSLKRWNSYNIFGPKPVITQLNSGGGEIPPVQSEIRQGWWIDRKNNYTAAIRMDENSVGGILNGKVMESRILITNFTFDPTDFDKLNYIEVKATRSPTQ